MKKKIFTVLGVVGLSFSTTTLAACSNSHNNAKNEKSSQTSTIKSVKKENSKSKSKNINVDSDDKNNNVNINNDEWMMMGYIAYRAENGSISPTLDEVKADFNNGNLTVVKNSADSYKLSNNYGSVNVDVKNSKVIVSNDGNNIFSKDSLKKNFGNDLNTIKSLVSYISTSSNSSNSTDSNSGEWKSGVPSELIGAYQNYHNEDEEKNLQTVIVYNFWKDSFTFWQSSDLTRFATNVKYKNSGSTYTFKFDETEVGGGYHLPDDSPTLSNGMKYRTVPNQQITIIKQGNDIKIDGPLLYKANSYSLAKTPNDM